MDPIGTSQVLMVQAGPTALQERTVQMVQVVQTVHLAPMVYQVV